MGGKTGRILHQIVYRAMKYVIPCILLIWTLLLIAATGYSIYATFVSSPLFILLVIGFGMSGIAGILATSSAFSAIKNW